MVLGFYRIPKDCEVCIECTNSEVVQKVVYGIQKLPENEWTNYSIHLAESIFFAFLNLTCFCRDIALRKTVDDVCRPKKCDLYDEETCPNDCAWTCHEVSTPSESISEDERSVMCKTLVLNWESVLESPDVFCSEQKGVLSKQIVLILCDRHFDAELYQNDGFDLRDFEFGSSTDV